jgi:CrcB protein
MIKNLLLIGIGGFVGSVARYLVSKLNLHLDFFSIPMGTLLVNVLGCFLIGFLTGISEKSTLLNVELRMFQLSQVKISCFCVTDNLDLFYYIQA